MQDGYIVKEREGAVARIHIHEGGGCEAIVNETGNELSDEDVRVYLCQSSATMKLTVVGIVKHLCQEHYEKTERWSREVMGISERNDDGR